MCGIQKTNNQNSSFNTAIGVIGGLAVVTGIAAVVFAVINGMHPLHMGKIGMHINAMTSSFVLGTGVSLSLIGIVLLAVAKRGCKNEQTKATKITTQIRSENQVHKVPESQTPNSLGETKNGDQETKQLDQPPGATKNPGLDLVGLPEEQPPGETKNPGLDLVGLPEEQPPGETKNQGLDLVESAEDQPLEEPKNIDETIGSQWPIEKKIEFLNRFVSEENTEFTIYRTERELPLAKNQSKQRYTDISILHLAILKKDVALVEEITKNIKFSRLINTPMKNPSGSCVYPVSLADMLSSASKIEEEKKTYDRIASIIRESGGRIS